MKNPDELEEEIRHLGRKIEMLEEIKSFKENEMTKQYIKKEGWFRAHFIKNRPMTPRATFYASVAVATGAGIVWSLAELYAEAQPWVVRPLLALTTGIYLSMVILSYKKLKSYRNRTQNYSAANATQTLSGRYPDTGNSPK